MSDLSEYPPEWPLKSLEIKAKAGGKCERCRHIHEVKTGYVLTVHHLDGNKHNLADWNLAALCQRCHLKIQGRVKMSQLFMLDIMPVAGWFKPHYDGYMESLIAQPQTH